MIKNCKKALICVLPALLLIIVSIFGSGDLVVEAAAAPDVHISTFVITAPAELVNYDQEASKKLREILEKTKKVSTSSQKTGEVRNINNSILGSFSVYNNDVFWDGNLNYEVALFHILPKGKEKISSSVNKEPLVLKDKEVNTFPFVLSYPKNIKGGNYILKLSIFERSGTLLDTRTKKFALRSRGETADITEAIIVDQKGEEKSLFNNADNIYLKAQFSRLSKANSAYARIVIKRDNQFGEIIKDEWLKLLSSNNLKGSFNFKIGKIKQPGRYFVYLQLFNTEKESAISPEIDLSFRVRGQRVRIFDVFSYSQRVFMGPPKGVLPIKIGALVFSSESKKKVNLKVRAFNSNKKKIYEGKKEIEVLPRDNSNKGFQPYYFEFTPKENINSYYAVVLVERDGKILDQKAYFHNLAPIKNVLAVGRNKSNENKILLNSFSKLLLVIIFLIGVAGIYLLVRFKKA